MKEVKNIIPVVSGQVHKVTDAERNRWM